LRQIDDVVDGARDRLEGSASPCARSNRMDRIEGRGGGEEMVKEPLVR
jgi:hypothetical protein